VPPALLLAVQISVILALSRLATPIAARLGQPPVMAEMIAGLLLGPSLLGWFAPNLSGMLFPPASLPALSAIGQVGIIVFLFLVGWRLEIETLKTVGRMALVISVVSIAVPFALGSTVAVVAWHPYAPDGVALLPFALFMGAAMSITAFPVLARILADQGLTRTRIGVLAMTCAAFDDAVGWLILAAITMIVVAGNMANAGGMLAGLALYLVVMFGLVHPLVTRIARRPGESFGRSPRSLAIMVVVTVASAYTTDALGVHALFGAFLAGVVMPRDEEAERVFGEAVEPMAVTFLLPIFFAFSGLRTGINLIAGPELWGQMALILGVAVAGKGVGTAVAARATGAAWADATLLGVLMNTRGLIELVVLNIGFDLGILSPVLFSMMVVMALTTTLVTSPLVSRLKGRASMASDAST
jgi:Kef-type K+ transport system membrane component KefB